MHFSSRVHLHQAFLCLSFCYLVIVLPRYWLCYLMMLIMMMLVLMLGVDIDAGIGVDADADIDA